MLGGDMQIAIDVTLDYRLPTAHDVLLQIEAAEMADQRIIESELLVRARRGVDRPAHLGLC